MGDKDIPKIFGIDTNARIIAHKQEELKIRRLHYTGIQGRVGIRSLGIQPISTKNVRHCPEFSDIVQIYIEVICSVCSVGLSIRTPLECTITKIHDSEQDIMAEVINNIRDYRRSAFFPAAFPDGSGSLGPIHSPSTFLPSPPSFLPRKTYQESIFGLERSSPVHYTASMPDFQVFLISDAIEDDKKLPEKKVLCDKKVLHEDYNPYDQQLIVENKRKSPTMGYSSEAPARLNSPQRFLKPFRQRAVSLSILERTCESFVTLENTSTALFDLPTLVSRADNGLKYGVDPILAEGAMGGTYFLRDKGRLITVVCKPGDEEPNSPNNPYQEQNGFLGSSYKGRIIPGT